MKKPYCPLMKSEIEDVVCFDIHCVVEGISPKDEAPSKVLDTEDFEAICNACEHHHND